MNLLDKTYLNVERGKLNEWWVFSDGEYLTTYEVIHLLYEYQDELKKLTCQNNCLKQENE